MKLGNCYIPAEILLAVAGELPTKDLKKVRLACKELEAVASRFLITKLWISPAYEDQQKMLVVARHPIFSQTVTEIAYDASWSLDEDPRSGTPFSQAQYVRFFCNALMGRRLGCPISKAAAVRGYKIYKQRRDEEDALIAYFAADCTRGEDRIRLPPNFNYYLEQPEKHHEILDFLPSDLATLVKALPQLTKVKRFDVSDERFTGNQYRYFTDYGFSDYGFDMSPLAYALDNWGVRGKDAVVLMPRRWIRNEEDYLPVAGGRKPHRGFEVMMQAASMMGLSGLESLCTDRSDKASGLSCQVLDMSSSLLHHSLRAFAHLRHLTLKLNTEVMMDMFRFGDQWSGVIQKGALAQLCTVARGLETLNLQLNGPGWLEEDEAMVPANIAPLDKLIGTSAWPKLASVKFAWMSIPRDELLSFFSRHRRTLRRLSLNGVTIPAINTTVNTFPGHHEPSPALQKNGLKAIAEARLELQYFKFKNDPNESDWPYVRQPHFESEDPAVILQFLASGGDNGYRTGRPHGAGCLCPPYSPSSAPGSMYDSDVPSM